MEEAAGAHSRLEEGEAVDAEQDVAEAVHFEEVAVEAVEPQASAGTVSTQDTSRRRHT